MKLFLKNERVTRRSTLGALIGALAMTVAACAGGNTTTATSPSGVSPFVQNVQPVWNFTVTMTGSPLTVPGGTLHVTVTNTGGGSAALGSVRLTLENGLTPVDATNFQSVSGSKAWFKSSISGQVVIVGATSGTNKLDPTDAISFDLAVTSSACDTYTITSEGSNETPATFTLNSWVNTTGPVDVTVTGCVACSDPHAPAVANDYVKNVLHIDPNDIPGSIYGAMIREIGQLTAEDGTFQGLSPCDHPAYENAVIAYVENWISTHSS